MWHSPDGPPLDRDEQKRVRRLQIAPKAVKTCGGCARTLSVNAFPRYEARFWCEGCPAVAQRWPVTFGMRVA